MKHHVQASERRHPHEPPPSGQKPHGRLSAQEVTVVAEALVAYHARFHDLVGRREPREWREFYLRGQLSHLARKTSEPMVLHFKGADWSAVRAVQQFIGEGAWHDARILERLQELVAEDLGEADAMVILAGRAFPQQGLPSVGVARQYCGHLGKVANCHHGVFAAYASSKGHAFLDRRLSMPQEWFDEAHTPLRARYGVPEGLQFRTEPALGLEMVQGLVERATVPFSWVLADETYGADPKCLDGVAALSTRYVVEVPVSPSLWVGRIQVEPAGKGARGRPRKDPRVVEGTPPRQEGRQIAAALPERAWRRYRIKEGAKGTIEAEFAFVQVTRSTKGGKPAAEAVAVLRRHPEDSTVKVFLTNAPKKVARRALARVGGMRWPIETAFEEAKGEVGMDHYEVRTWRGWHHHLTQSFLAHHFLVRMRQRGKKSGADAAAGEAAGGSDSCSEDAYAREGHRDCAVSATAQLRGISVTPGSHRRPASKAPKAA
jgi:SRSO17 transposase